MPRGSHHVEVGQLDHDGRSLGLLRDDGGRWQLSAPRRARRLIGQRVRIEGVRVGFAELDVNKIEPLAAAENTGAEHRRMNRALVAGLLLIGLLGWTMLG